MSSDTAIVYKLATASRYRHILDHAPVTTTFPEKDVRLLWAFSD